MSTSAPGIVAMRRDIVRSNAIRTLIVVSQVVYLNHTATARIVTTGRTRRSVKFDIDVPRNYLRFVHSW